jgi:hypothetical protein
MKTTTLFLLLLFVTICGYAQPAANALKSAQRMTTAFVNGDYNTFCIYSHPVIVKSMGGKAKMIAFFEKNIQQLKSQGNSFKKVTVGDISKMYKSGTELQCSMTQTLVMGVRGGTLTSRSSIVGFSADQGKTWTFASPGEKTAAEMKALIPSYNQQLVLLKPEKPVFRTY